MDIVLGVSMTPATVRMVLVEGARAEGATVEHDVFDITTVEGAATSDACDQVIAAILGTRESAVAGGHRLWSAGVACSDHALAAALREALAARGIEGVALVSELQAAAALAQAAAGVVGYDQPGVLLICGDSATLWVVDAADGSIVNVETRSLCGTHTMAVLTDMVTGLSDQPCEPDGLFLVGQEPEVTAVKANLEQLVTFPITAPSGSDVALARGAALAAANIRVSGPATEVQAYSREHDAATAVTGYPPELVAEIRRLLAVGYDGADIDAAPAFDDDQAGRKPFLLVGSSLAAIFMIGVVSLVISLAVSIRPTVDTRPGPDGPVMPPQAAPQLPTLQNMPPAAPPPRAAPPAAPMPAAPPPAAPPPNAPPPAVPPPIAAQVIPEPVPVVKEVPRAVAPAPAPARKAPAALAPAAPPPPPAAPPPPPAALPPAPVPAAPAPVPGYPPTAYPPGYAPGPGYPPTAYPPGYPPAPAYGPGARYGPDPAFGPGPAYGPGPGYAPAPAAPVVPIVPPVIGIGPGPLYRAPAREEGPGWYPPPQRSPGRYRSGDDGPDGWGRGGPHGRSPLWPWPSD